LKKLIYALILLIYLSFQMFCPARSSADDKYSNCQNIMNKIKDGAFLVDVRTKEEFDSGSLSGSINVPYDQIEINLNQFSLDKNKEIFLYCKSGRRSELGKQSLAKLGYINVINAGSYDELLKCRKNK